MNQVLVPLTGIWWYTPIIPSTQGAQDDPDIRVIFNYTVNFRVAKSN